MNRRLLHIAFRIGVLLKALDGALELLGGALLIVTPTWKLIDWTWAITAEELSEDRTDWIATHVRAAAAGVTPGERLFASVYLLAHGIVKVIVVLALLRGRRWAYPVAVAVFGAFAVYQGYEWTVTHAASLVALTILDVAVILLTLGEWRRAAGR